MNSQLSAPQLTKISGIKACHVFQKFGFCVIRLWKFSYLDRRNKKTKTESCLLIFNHKHTLNDWT